MRRTPKKLVLAFSITMLVLSSTTFIFAEKLYDTKFESVEKKSIEHAFIDDKSDALYSSPKRNLQVTCLTNYLDLKKGNWEVTSQGKRYKRLDGTYATGIVKIGDYNYYFNSDGYMQTGLQEISGNKYYFNNLGHMETGWKYIEDKWYYFNNTGQMETGWQKIDGKHYFLYEDGRMASNERTPDGYYVNKSGVWIKDEWKKNSIGWWYQYGEGNYAIGWAEISGKKYYFNNSGYMETGWIYTNGIWYYSNSTGYMEIGWKIIGDKYYYLYEDGHMASDEITPDGYYVNKSGVWTKDEWKKNSIGWWYQYKEGGYAIGWTEISGKKYYFNNSGYMETGWVYIDDKWYYMDVLGEMRTGWIYVDCNYYYLYDDGHMASNEITPDGYKVESSGIWLSEPLQNMITKANSYNSSTNYLMLVDCYSHKIGIFTGEKDSWNYKTFWDCTTGAPSTPTVKGVFHIGDKGKYFDSGSARCHWWTQFYEDYLFHSVLYNKNGTIYDGRLGMSLSHGCIRLKIEHAKWIYDYIPRGTTVVIY